MKEEFLLPRGYKSSVIEQAFQRIRNLPGQTYEVKRNAALEKKIKENKNKERLVVPLNFNPLMPKASSVLNKHYRAMVKKNEKLLEVFPSNPLAGMRQPKNLRRLLCSSRLQPVKRSSKFRRNTHAEAPGWKKCGKPCPVCPFTLQNSTEVVSQVTGYTHKIESPVNCQSENCIYYWKCDKENCADSPCNEYIGMTKRTFQKRFSEHRDYPKRNIW